MGEIDELRTTVEELKDRVRLLEDQVELGQLVWVARVSANSWRWVRTPAGWRTVERINANLDGTPEHRGVLTPPTGRREAN